MPSASLALAPPPAPALTAPAHPRGEAMELLMDALTDPDPLARLREARDSGGLARLVPELAPTIGMAQGSRHHDHNLDEHLFRAAGEAARIGASWRIRLAALLHDIGKPSSMWVDGNGRTRFSPHPAGAGHARTGADIAGALLLGIGFPARFAAEIADLVREHMYCEDRDPTPASAFDFVVRVGARPARELMMLRRCDRASKREGGLRPEDEARLLRFERLVAAVDVPLVLAA